MPESIESFVKKLQTEGITAGREAAEKIREEAKHEAGKILAEAKAEAEKILAEAKSAADRRLSRAQTELELTVRDVFLKLRESIDRVLSALITRRIEKTLSDPHYLAEVIREVVTAYARADAEGHSHIEINLPAEMQERLKDNVFQDLFGNLRDEQDRLKLKATLAGAGFEYSLHGATVEVSPESISELITDMVGPSLREIMDRIIDRESEASLTDSISNTDVHLGRDGSEGGEG